jgi:type IV pilus assembly protein PilF
VQVKKKFNGLILAVMCLFLNACVAPEKMSRSMSDEEKANLYLQMGVRYLEMNMLKIAQEKLNIALSFNPEDAELQNALGVMHERLQQNTAAGQHYKKAVKINADDFRIKNNYGRFLCESGKYLEGVRLLKQALALPLNNRKWFAYTNIGRCELKNAKPALAETNFRLALQKNTRYAPALAEMQRISYNKGQFLSARAFLERYLGVAKHTSETLWYAVQTERGLGNKALVEQYRERLFGFFPASSEAQQLKTAIKLY